MSFAPIALRRDRVVEVVGLRETLALSPDSLIPKNRKRLGPQPTFQRRQGKNHSDQTSLKKLSDCFEGAPLQEWPGPNLSGFLDPFVPAVMQKALCFRLEPTRLCQQQRMLGACRLFADLAVCPVPLSQG